MTKTAKTAPKPAAAKPAKTKPAAPPAEAPPAETKPKAPAHRRLAARCRDLAARLAKTHATLTRWGLTDQAEDMNEARTRATDTARTLEALPPDWTRPERGAATIIAGATVALRPRIAAEYEGLVEGPTFTVVAVRGKRVLVQDGANRPLLPRAHLMLAKPAAPAATTAPAPSENEDAE